MATYTWTGQGKSQAWDDAGNWSPGGMPGAADLAVFTSANAMVTGNEVAGAVSILSPTDLSFTGTVTTRGLAGLASSFAVGGGAEVAFVAGSALDVADRLTVGLGGGTSDLEVDGAALTSRSAVIGTGSGVAGALSLDGGAQWQNSGTVIVGATGDGGLSIGGGGLSGSSVVLGVFGRHPHGGNLVLGQHAGADGTVDVSGGGNLLTNGTIALGGGIGAAAHGSGQLSVGTGSTVNAYGDVTAAAGSLITLGGGSLVATTLDVAAGATLAGDGFATARTGLVNDGQVSASGTLFLVGDISGAGTLGIGAAATLGIVTARVGQAAIAFLGGGGTLLLTQAYTQVAAEITGFGAGDRIDAHYVDHVSFDAGTDMLSLYEGKSLIGTLALAGNFAGDTFHVHYAGSYGTITLAHG